ncbi:AMP-binding protein [Parerythrobacter aestuarii]|uniref:AMP-binding protein n=1 Tax=Parerythrobacter aestuarii TaxID=3020909 RepID=UPI0024DEB3B6|nr:AMP-binding protein [Parerythrobacter aestuarii]
MILLDSIATYAEAMPNKRAVVDLESGREWNYSELNAVIDRLAAWLHGRFGNNSGTRIATLTKNCAEMPILQFACVRAGCIFMPMNWRLAVAELEALAADAEPHLLFLQDGFTAPGNVAEVLDVTDMLGLGEEGSSAPIEARRDFEDVSTLLYTSGTSGRPKGVMLSECNIFWGCTNLIHGNAVNPSSTFLCDMPLFHTAGLMAATRTPLFAGGAVLISPGFDPKLTLERMVDPGLGVTHYFSVPQMATTLWQRPEFEAAKLHKIVAWAIGGAPNPKAQSERFLGAGVRISEGFGMSETGSNFAIPPFELDLMLSKAGSCGLPLMTQRAKIVDEDGNEVPPGEQGELLVSGPSIAMGYWQQPELTAKAFVDGWFHTGDAAMMDEDGYFYIVDRKKDMYISGGENVYPAEVEAALAELDTVGQVAVIGVPDERWGEVGRAYVIPATGKSITADEVIAHCAARLAKFKVPKSAVITDEIPATASGKVQKHLLKVRAAVEMASE